MSTSSRTIRAARQGKAAHRWPDPRKTKGLTGANGQTLSGDRGTSNLKPSRRALAGPTD